MRCKAYLKYILILLLPTGFLLNYISSLNSKMTQQVYSNFLYKGISKVVSGITRLLPLSTAEIMLILLVLFIFFKIGVVCIKLGRNSSRRFEIVKNALINVLAFIGVIYFTFIIMWGMNYNRLPISQIFKLEIKPASVEELTGLCKYLIGEANELRSMVDEDARGVMYPENGYKGVFERAASGFKTAAEVYPQLGPIYGKPKPMLLSGLISYTGIWGIYTPFTSEANINIYIPAPFLPSTTCHEMAHQLGFAREEEANYIAYLTCKMHSDDDFKYSGVLLALVNTMNELYQYDSNIYNDLMSELNDGVIRDIQEISRFNKYYDSPVRQAFSKCNDLYLKANRQKDGERSYRRVVDLLIAEYRLYNDI